VSKKLHPCQQVGVDWLERAPLRFSNDIDVALTPDDLFGVLARADPWPRWATVITHVEYTSPEPHGVGTTRIVTMRGGMVADEEFLAWEPGRQLAFRFTSSATKSLGAFVENYRLEPIAGGTRMTWELGMELAGPSKVLSPLTRPVTDAVFRRFLRNLQRLCADGVPA
jgi:carbon monoxide dehydrogenase subunit G